MGKVDIPVKVNVTEANESPGDGVLFQDLYIDDNGDLVLDVIIHDVQEAVKFRKI